MVKAFELVQSRGTARYPEDTFVVNEPVFGVFDAHSEVYSSISPLELIDGKTSGQVVGQIIRDVFQQDVSCRSITDLLLRANNLIGSFNFGRTKVTADELAGAVFAVVGIYEDCIKIIQAGDCVVFWQYKNGFTGGIRSQTYYYEQENKRIIADLMAKHNGDRDKMWIEFDPILRQRRQDNANKTYAVMNGQSTMEKQWQKSAIATKNVKRLFLCTDGFFWPEFDESNMSLAAKDVMALYEDHFLSVKASLPYIRRRQLSLASERSHEALPELTAIALDFEF